MITGDPVEFRLKPNTYVNKLSMEQCQEYIFQNRNLLIRTSKKVSKLEQIRSAIFSTQNAHEINRIAGYMWLYDNFLKNVTLPTPSIDFEEQKKQIEEEQKKQFLAQLKENSIKEETQKNKAE